MLYVMYYMYVYDICISCPWYKIDILLSRVTRRPGHAHLHPAQFWIIHDDVTNSIWLKEELEKKYLSTALAYHHFP